MSCRMERAFRPGAERVESRELTTGGLVGHVAAPAIVHHATIHAAVHHPPPRLPHFPYPGLPGVGPGIGKGLVRLALPRTFGDFGVVTLWNNTNTTVSFAVSASTFNNGLYYPFTLRSGQVRSFFAPVAKVTQTMPVFQVRFGPGSVPVVLPQDNLVFEASTYIPAGTAGWPYAINLGPNGYSISAI
jgi:hypothetical protein